MARLSRLLTTLALVAALSGSPALAQDIRINPVPPHVKPQWTPVPGASQVYYAPNLPTDVFRYRGKYYFFWAGFLYQGKKPRGPWKSVQEVPAFFNQIDPAYFKTAKKPEAPAVPPTAPPETAAPAPPEPAPEAAPPAAPAPPEATQAAPAPQPEDSPDGPPPQPPKVM